MKNRKVEEPEHLHTLSHQLLTEDFWKQEEEAVSSWALQEAPCKRTGPPRVLRKAFKHQEIRHWLLEVLQETMKGEIQSIRQGTNQQLLQLFPQKEDS